MKKIITALFVVNCSLFIGALSASNTQCSEVERMLNDELSQQFGATQTIEDHVRTARVYRAMANRGCSGNAEAYKEYSRASLDAARSLVYIEGYKGAEKARYDNMIKQVGGY